MFSSRKIFLIEDWFDYAMVTANLKYTKKKNEKKTTLSWDRSPSQTKKKNTDTLKKQNKTKLTKKKTKKQNKHKLTNREALTVLCSVL